MSNKASVSGEEKESLAGEEHVPQSVNGVLGSGDTSAGQAEISASDIADLSTVVISHQLQLPLLISPPRRRSMTVPLEVALFPTAPACGAGPGDPEPPPDPSSSSSTSAASAPTTLPPRKPNRFVVSKISEQTLKDGGSALILPAQRSSANSSLAGSPEVGRARSPLVYSEGQMVSPSMDGALPTIIPSKSRTSSFSRGASLSRGASKDHPDLMDSPVLPEPSPPEHEPFVFLGVCAMAKKAKSKYMTEILTRITQEFEQIKTIVFDEQQILNDPVEKWPIVDALISFQSERFPLERAVQYAKLRNPFLVNDLEMQFVIKDRRKVYELLKSEGIDLPRYGVLDRDSGKPEDARIEEFDDYVVVNGATFNKPFVEKPICADDHNVYIYYPMSAGGGSQRLFRKIGSRSSVYSNESKVRKTGSFIYEEFMPTDGTDVKVYTVGLEYAHAEARKSPALDGVVERDKEGKEIRFPVILNNIEKLIARRVCLAFKQTVCGFDLLRTNGRSYVCDVNGFSFVKNSMIYYNDCAKIVANNILRRLAPELHIPWAMPYQLEDPPIVTTTQGKMMELRCVVAIIRHGDRTPKQKMKMEMRHAMFFAVFTKFGGKLDADGREIKLKKPDQLQEILDIVRQLLAHHLHEAEVKEKRAKLEQLKSVLEMYGHFSGINRKIQIKYQPLERADTPERNQASSPITETQEVDPMLPAGNLVLIMKWGGELTPLGKYQSEQLGQMFRCMYPGSGEFSRKKGHGLLRLHSTFRHDLKIYASDEGRVQTTAAAFAKGLLALEGELTPILVQMVKSADTNGLLDNDVDARESENTTAFYLKSEHFELAKFFHSVKKRLKSILKQDRDFVAADYEILNPTNSVSVKIAMDVIKNPVKACEAMCDNIRDLNVAINEKASNKEIELPTLYSGESWDLLQRRWGKLEKDFRLRDGNFDITKIPDIYDCIKFDMHHNQWINRFTCAKKLFALARNLANIVVPMEYGINSKEKLAIAQGVATPLLRKIRGDLQHVVDYLDDPENTNRLDPRFSQNVASPGRLVRSRLYFTSESHIHSLVNILRFGGLIAADDEQWSRAMKYISTVPEFNFLTQIVIMMYEDPNKDHNSDDRFHIELHFSPGMLLRNDDLEPEGPGFLRFGKPSRSNSVSHEAPDSTVTAKASQVTLKNDNTLHEPTGPPRKLSSMSHLAEGWLDNLDANSTINFPKTRYDRSVFRLNESGVVMNRVFSTAVIKGVSSGSSLDKIDDSNDNSDIKCLHVPNVDSLETLHNEISFKQLNEFFKRITESSSRQVSAVTSPARTPDASLVTSLSETDDNHNRFWTNPESLAADLLNQEKNMERRFSASNDMITENGHFDVDFSVTNASDDGGMSTPDPLMMDMASLQPPDSGGVDRSISPASSPVIESLLFSPSKDRMEEGDPCEEPMDDLPHRVVRALSFDFEMDGVKD